MSLLLLVAAGHASVSFSGALNQKGLLQAASEKGGTRSGKRWKFFEDNFYLFSGKLKEFMP